MIVEVRKIGNATVTIHDDCVVSKEKSEQILKNIGIMVFNATKRGETVGRSD